METIKFIIQKVINRMKRIVDTIEKIPDGKLGLYFFVITLILRVLYSLFAYFFQSLPETNLYYELAQDIIDQGKILYDTSHPYYEFPGPGIIWINALTMLLFGKNYLGLYLVTSIVSALITLYTFKLSRLIVDKTTAFIIGLWSTFYIFNFFYTPTPGKDIWMAFFMVYLLYLFCQLFIENGFSFPKLILFTTVYTFSFHLDERFFVFAPLIGLYMIYWETKGFKKFAIVKTISFGLLMILLMIPWTIRNYQKHDKIVILSTRTEAFIDPIFGYEPRGHMMDEFNDIYGAYYIHDYQIDSVIAGLKTKTDMGRNIDKAMVEAMKRGEMPEPLTGIKAMWVRTISMLEPFQLKGRYERSGYFYYKKSIRHNAVTFISYGFLFIFSFYGFFLLYQKNKLYFYLFATVILVYVLLHALTIPYTNWRYRLPLDSIFMIVGWLGIMNIYKMTLNRLKTNNTSNVTIIQPARRQAGHSIIQSINTAITVFF